LVLALAREAHAQASLRIGTMAPKNSLYHRQLLDVGEAWRIAQNNQGKFLVFTDGTQGGEAEMVRRMRIGQLHGVLMSVTGLREIDRSISALQNMPLMFRNWDEVDYVREHIRKDVEARFLDKGFVILSWGDAGWVRFFSKQPAFRPNDYRGMKFFTWGSEPDQQAIMKSLGYTPVPLETNDILPAMQTGMITVVPSTPYFALASQVFSSAPNMLELNWAPIVGALLVTKKAWDGMTAETQAAMRSAAEKAGVAMRAKARQEVDEAVTAMVKRGLKVNRPTAEQSREWDALAQTLHARVRGSMVPAEIFDEVVRHLKVYRERQDKKS
jgi:TRAP-type C4-dicarboxylate transport system substrate-binding protein